jgi:hypothetical protein
MYYTHTHTETDCAFAIGSDNQQARIVATLEGSGGGGAQRGPRTSNYFLRPTFGSAELRYAPPATLNSVLLNR